MNQTSRKAAKATKGFPLRLGPVGARFPGGSLYIISLKGPTDDMVAIARSLADFTRHAFPGLGADGEKCAGSSGRRRKIRPSPLGEISERNLQRPGSRSRGRRPVSLSSG